MIQMFNTRPKWIRTPRRLVGGLAAAGAALVVAAILAGGLFAVGQPTAHAAGPDGAGGSKAHTGTNTDRTDSAEWNPVIVGDERLYLPPDIGEQRDPNLPGQTAQAAARRWHRFRAGCGRL